jgi:hypothetical protein
VALADKKVTLLNGLLEIQQAQPCSLSTGGVHDEKGITVVVGSAEFRMRLGRPDADDEARAWIEVTEEASSGPARALRLFHRPTGPNLYSIVEIVADDLGGLDAIAERRWASLRDLRLLKQTLQFYESAGDDARHGKASGRPPRDPMALNDARILTRRILERWLNEKGDVPGGP